MPRNNVTIRLIGPYAQFIGTNKIEINVSETIHILQLFHQISDRFGQKAQFFLDASSGEHGGQFVVAVNGLYVHPSKRESTYLEDGDIVSIIPAITGG